MLLSLATFLPNPLSQTKCLRSTLTGIYFTGHLSHGLRPSFFYHSVITLRVIGNRNNRSLCFDLCLGHIKRQNICVKSLFTNSALSIFTSLETLQYNGRPSGVMARPSQISVLFLLLYLNVICAMPLSQEVIHVGQDDIVQMVSHDDFDGKHSPYPKDQKWTKAFKVRNICTNADKRNIIKS